jgi:DNA-binding winged helix-turn-helix (wHTH) protein
VIDEPKQVYEFDEFRLDAMKRRLTRHGEVVPLYSKAFDLLLVMVQNGGRDLTKEALLDTVWPDQTVEESNLTVNMSAVRKALGEKAAQPRYIVNIPGRGYRFVASLRAADEVGVVIESQSISQITVEQETETDRNSPSSIPESSTSLAGSLIAVQPEAKQLGAPAPPTTDSSGAMRCWSRWSCSHPSWFWLRFLRSVRYGTPEQPLIDFSGSICGS